MLVEPRDLTRFRSAGRNDLAAWLAPGHFSLPALPTDETGRCVYQGTTERAHDCSIYELRPQACRDFRAGSPECVAARALGMRH